ncbi:CRISPR-associated endonuclease Cas1 [Methylomarinum sp. Ch1-1]|uniref:CRISPR-associated endonuclease Cas1 n=1 Tax=Methylomarinum roseum TaxID=3067653 RepID=A0AAU7NQ12_9GAMM|nr:CRISPR-associated endonuclease Cas1 [Methylomarinum sp. Ch1-1]MDP4521006.1 CRISPR-associated endonuclease Cas1 [Methylomarinum sp. Ch1-1]
MSTLYLDRKGLALKLDGHAMALYENDVKRGTIPFRMLEKVVVRGNVTLESRLLCALGRNQVDILFLSGRNSQRGTMSFSHKHNDAKRRLTQYKVSLGQELQRNLATGLVLAKLEKQLQMLESCLSKRPDLRKTFTSAIRSLQVNRRGIMEQNEGVASVAQLRGYEGAAAAAYFSAFTQLFSPKLGFNARNKRPPTDPVNACLSLGYTLLHFEAVGVCYMVGLEPMLGFYHEPAFGRESLACDLIEPLRPRLDALVWSLFRDRKLRVEQFVFENKRCLLNKDGRKVFYAEYERFAHPVRRLLRLQGHSLARFYLQAEKGVSP